MSSFFLAHPVDTHLATLLLLVILLLEKFEKKHALIDAFLLYFA